MKKFRTVQYNTLRGAEKHSIGVIPAEAGNGSRHCGLDPQSPTINAFKREIAGQARNDGHIFCLNQDFNKIYKITKINPANPDNIDKIPVQDKDENIKKMHICKFESKKIKINI